MPRNDRRIVRQSRQERGCRKGVFGVFSACGNYYGVGTKLSIDGVNTWKNNNRLIFSGINLYMSNIFCIFTSP